MRTFLFTLLSLASIKGFALTLSEDLLFQEWKKNSPELKSLESEQLTAQYQWQQRQEMLQWSLDGELTRTKSQIEPFFQFAPALRVNENYQAHISKMTSLGIAGKVGASKTRTSNTLLRSMTQNTLEAEVSVDLWKNLFGEEVRESLRELSLQSEIATLSRQVQTKALWQSVRKVFWNLAATDESLAVAKEQLNLAQEQFKDTKDRARNAISEAGDVARSQAQVSTRLATIASLQYQREKLAQRLRQWVPGFDPSAEFTLDLKALNLEGAHILACTETIHRLGTTLPKENTLIDNMMEKWRESYQASLTATKHYSRPEVKLITAFQVFGQGIGGEKARRDFSDNPKTQNTIGLRLTIPLSSEVRDTESTLKRLREQRFFMQYDRYRAQIEEEHRQMIRSIGLMNTLLREQSQASQQLSNGLKASRTKFRQARIGLRELIQDQDQYFQSELGSIQAKLTIAEALLDYLAVFTETPCSFNKNLF
jgi:outer membrane protein TolC